MTLNDLAREMPSDDDLDNYLEHIFDESDRGVAIMASALVERALENLIRTRHFKAKDVNADIWFEGANAPFRTFSAKISLARALGAIDDYIEKRLVTVKNIRNAFAHRSLPLTFDHPTVAAECRLLPPEAQANSEMSAQRMFAVSCLTLSRSLGLKSVVASALKAALEVSVGTENGA